MHVKKNDKVVVISGQDAGKIGKVLSSNPKENKVVVEGVNMLTKHKKATRDMQQAGIIHQEGPIDASNVLVYCDKCKQGVRTGMNVSADGSKARTCKKCGETIK